MKDFEATIKVFKDWAIHLDKVFSKLSNQELTKVCTKAGVNPRTIKEWHYKGQEPTLGLFIPFITTAYSHIKKRDLLSNNISGVAL